MIQLMLVLLTTLSVGEKLSYQVKYGPLSAGTLTLEVAGVEEVAGESCYHLISRLRSNPAYSSLFTLNDRIDSYARVADFVTLRTVKDVHESNYHREIAADFDYAKNLVAYSDMTSMTLEGECRDLVSLWYYCRSLALKPGEDFEVSSHVDRRNYSVVVSVSGRKTVRTRLGSYRCLVLQMESSGPAGSGVIYLSDDDEGLPVMIKTRLPLGYITATLTAVE